MLGISKEDYFKKMCRPPCRCTPTFLFDILLTEDHKPPKSEAIQPSSSTVGLMVWDFVYVEERQPEARNYYRCHDRHATESWKKPLQKCRSWKYWLGLEPAARDSLLEAVRQLEAESSAEREVSACLQNQQTVPETASSEASCF